MAYTPYDWQQTLSQKADYADDRLWGGSPVVAVSADDGIVLLTTQRSQRKLFEIYDQLAFAGIGTPSDLEAVRVRAVDFAHAEGYQRSPEDVSIQRVVGFAISPLLKQAYADPMRLPLVLRGVFTQLGHVPDDDLFYVLNYDGDFVARSRYGVAAGASLAEDHMQAALDERIGSGADDDTTMPRREDALALAITAWSAGQWALTTGGAEGETIDLPDASELNRALTEALETETLEASILERDTDRERHLRELSRTDLEPFLP